MPNILDPNFQYTPAIDTAQPGYLRERLIQVQANLSPSEQVARKEAAQKEQADFWNPRLLRMLIK